MNQNESGETRRQKPSPGAAGLSPPGGEAGSMGGLGWDMAIQQASSPKRGPSMSPPLPASCSTTSSQVLAWEPTENTALVMLT